MPNVLLTLNTTPRAYEPRIWIVVDHTIQHYTSLFPKGEVTIGYFHHRICYESLNLMLGCVGLLHWRFILLLSDQPGTSQRWQFKRIHNRILWEKRVCAPWGRAGMAVGVRVKHHDQTQHYETEQLPDISFTAVCNRLSDCTTGCTTYYIMHFRWRQLTCCRPTAECMKTTLHYRLHIWVQIDIATLIHVNKI